MAASLFNFVVRDIASIRIKEIHPLIKAPKIKYNGFLVPEIINAKATPGKIEWEMASPTSARFLKKAKQPTIAAVAPKIILPKTTKRTLGSEKLKNFKVSSMLYCSRTGKSF